MKEYAYIRVSSKDQQDTKRPELQSLMNTVKNAIIFAANLEIINLKL